jgi:hypothetical protein
MSVVHRIDRETARERLLGRARSAAIAAAAGLHISVFTHRAIAVRRRLESEKQALVWGVSMPGFRVPHAPRQHAELYLDADHPCVCNWDVDDIGRIFAVNGPSGAVRLTMSKQQLIGWGAIALGLAFAFAALFELLTGQFMPGGYRKDAQWETASSLLGVFRTWGPYVSGLIWLSLALLCTRMGIKVLREAGVASRRSSDPL